MEIEILEKTSRISMVHHADARGVWATHNRTVMFKPVDGKEWLKVGTFPFAHPRDYFFFCRLARRFARSDRCNIFPTTYGRTLGIRAGQVYDVNGGFRPMFRIRGDCVLPRGIVEHESGNMYFGEYFMNPERRRVRIWRVSKDLGSFDVAHEFGPGSIRHVHGVYADPYSPGRLWVTMGDYERECFLMYSDDEFETVTRIGDGGQAWRAVGLLFSDNAVIWPTDSHIEQNYVVMMDRKTEKITKHMPLESSVWYSVQTCDGVLIAGLTIEKGAGVQTDESALLVSLDGRVWKPLLHFKKDIWPVKLFKSGNICFPSGTFSSESFWIFGEALKGLDGCAALCSIKR